MAQGHQLGDGADEVKKKHAEREIAQSQAEAGEKRNAERKVRHPQRDRRQQGIHRGRGSHQSLMVTMKNCQIRQRSAHRPR